MPLYQQIVDCKTADEKKKKGKHKKRNEKEIVQIPTQKFDLQIT